MIAGRAHCSEPRPVAVYQKPITPQSGDQEPAKTQDETLSRRSFRRPLGLLPFRKLQHLFEGGLPAFAVQQFPGFDIPLTLGGDIDFRALW